MAIRSIRHFGEYDSNDLDRLAIEFAQSVFDMVGKVDYVYWDNAETVLGRGIKEPLKRNFLMLLLDRLEKCLYKTVFNVLCDLWEQIGSLLLIVVTA